MKYYIAIADVHAELAKLEAACARIDIFVDHIRSRESDAEFQIVFLGDAIDRGPDPNGVLALVKASCEDGAIFIMGNHDMFLVGTAENDPLQARTWQINDGLETCKKMFPDPGPQHERHPSIDKDGSHTWDYREVIKESWQYKFYRTHGVMYHEADGIFFCHSPQIDAKGPHTAKMLLWGDSKAFDKGKDEAFKVPKNNRMSVHGHYHKLHYGQNFPRFVHYVHGGIKKTVVLADCGCGCIDWGECHPVIIRVNGKYPEIVAVL